MRLYREDYEDKQEAEYKKIDYEAWKNGFYVMNAVSVFMSKSNKYPQKPIEWEEIEREVDEGELDAMRFGAFAIAFNHDRKDGEESVERN
ncbi:MAG: hypothetical protein ACLUEC_10495 [Coprococcus sp.]